MDLSVYLCVEDIMVFMRELIHFLGGLFYNDKVTYKEKYNSLDDVLDRNICVAGIWINIDEYDNGYFKFIEEEYGADVNLGLWFDDVDFGKNAIIIAEIVNWIIKTSDTDMVIIPEESNLNFKKVNGKIYYGKESDFWPIEYIPVKDLDFDREEAIEFTHDDEWVFCSEEHIQKMEHWRKQQEKSEKPD